MKLLTINFTAFVEICGLQRNRDRRPRHHHGDGAEARPASARSLTYVNTVRINGLY